VLAWLGIDTGGALADDAETTRMQAEAAASEHYRNAVSEFVAARSADRAARGGRE
jgi:hypothetical protein